MRGLQVEADGGRGHQNGEGVLGTPLSEALQRCSPGLAMRARAGEPFRIHSQVNKGGPGQPVGTRRSWGRCAFLVGGFLATVQIALHPAPPRPHPRLSSE